jgi:hypothetical protein
MSERSGQWEGEGQVEAKLNAIAIAMAALLAR